MTGDRVTLAAAADRSRARAADMLAARDEHARETVEQARTRFPVYVVPEVVRERFPGFDPADPSTWPEPDKCTEGRPWGHDAYGYAGGLRDLVTRWQRYLDRPALLRPCRNRWRDEETRLCGTHLRPYRERVDAAERRLRTRAREEEHLDLARRLDAYGITADGRSTGVVLDAENARRLLDLLDPSVPDLTAPTPPER